MYWLGCQIMVRFTGLPHSDSTSAALCVYVYEGLLSREGENGLPFPLQCTVGLKETEDIFFFLIFYKFYPPQLSLLQQYLELKSGLQKKLSRRLKFHRQLLQFLLKGRRRNKRATRCEQKKFEHLIPISSPFRRRHLEFV